MKILLVSASFRPAYVYGGPIQSTWLLCEIIWKRGVDISVLTTKANGTDDLYVDSGRGYDIQNVQVRYFRRWTKDHSQFSPGLLWKLWNECKTYDVIHIQSWWNLVAVLSTTICLLRGQVPVISLRGTLSMHSFAHRKTTIKRLFHNTIGKRLLKKSYLHVTSFKEEQEAQAAIPGCRSVTIPNPMQLHENAVHPTVRENTVLKIIFLGRIHPVKNLELVLETFRSFQAVPWRLDIIGDGNTDYVHELQSRCQPSLPVRWLGTIAGMEKYHQLAQADLLILLSHTENFANVVIESLSQGTPVLVSKNVGVSQYIDEKNLGWVVNPDKQSVLETLCYIADHPHELQEIRSRAPSVIQGDFSPEILGQEFLQMYQQVQDLNAARV